MNAAVPAPARGRAALFSLLVALPLALPLSSAGFSLLSQLASAWLLLLSVGLPDLGAATARLLVLVGDEQDTDMPGVVFDGAPEREVAAKGAELVRSGRAQVFGSRSGEPVTVLGADALAVWAVEHLPAEPVVLPPFRIL